MSLRDSVMLFEPRPLRGTKGLLRKVEKDFAAARTANHCYFCGDRIDRRLYDPDRHRYYPPDGRKPAATVVLNVGEGVHATNIAGCCDTCSASLGSCGSIEELRWSKMLKAIGLKRGDMKVARILGVKPRVRYLRFWGEVGEGLETIRQFDERYAARYYNRETA